MKVKEISVEMEKSLSVQYNSVRLRLGLTAEFDGSSMDEFEEAVRTTKQALERLLDNQIIASVQALPRLKKEAEDKYNDIPY